MNVETYFQRFPNLRPSLHSQVRAYWVLHIFVLTFICEMVKQGSGYLSVLTSLGFGVAAVLAS